jgi:hypothetical protein
MTTLDEITYRTPDALFNGQAVISVIQSCVPNIKNAWQMPGMDIDTVLVAIRTATYGHVLDISSQCPKCGEEADYGADLRIVMDSIHAPDYSKQLNLGDLEIYFKPMSYKQMNENSMTQFEEQKTLQMLQSDDSDSATKLNQLGEVLKKITAVTTAALAQNIELVKTPSAQVSDLAHITEWLGNCDRTMFARIRDHIIAQKQQGELQPLDVKCNNCANEYKQSFTLDMTNFFGAAS